MSHFGHISISAVKFHICCNKFSSSLDHQIQISSKLFINPIHFFLIYIYFTCGAQWSAVGNQTRMRDVANFRSFLCLARRHIPQLTGAISRHIALDGCWGYCGSSHGILTAIAFLFFFFWDGHQKSFLLTGCLHLHACLRITGASLSFLDMSDCIEKQAVVWNRTDLLSIEKSRRLRWPPQWLHREGKNPNHNRKEAL